VTDEADGRLLAVAADAFLPDRPVRIGVALSGGGDSMAALHLMHAAGYVVEAITVDHLLRPEAAQEAVLARVACDRLGIPHEVVHWDEGPAATGNLMAEARRARYGLIAGWALHKGLAHVVVAHTADDQAETFLMRLARDAGLDGLSGMRTEWDEAGVSFCRPFLACTRDELRGYLQRRGIAWVDDPTNDDPRYERVRARRALAQLEPLGIDAMTLALTATRLAEARLALDWSTLQVARSGARIEAGDVIYTRDAVFGHPHEIQRRLLLGALRFVAGPGYPPREPALMEVEAAIGEGRDCTLGGVRVLVGDLAVPAPGLWDGRWNLARAPHPRPLSPAGERGDRAPMDGAPLAADAALEVRAVGEAGLALCPEWRATGLPRASLLASPGIWAGDRLVAAPLAGWTEGWKAELAEGRNSLADFLFPH
jgi:tRNA(Ile)-lysidine synthase